MKKLKIVTHHLIVFVLGSIGIGLFTLYHLTSPAGKSDLGGLAALPVFLLIYTVAFGILCLISLVIWLLVAYIRDRRTRI